MNKLKDELKEVGIGMVVGVVGATLIVGSLMLIFAVATHRSKPPKADPQRSTYVLKHDVSNPFVRLPMEVGWARNQMQNEMERVHAASPKKLAATPTLPAFSPIMHTQSIPQVMVQCTSAGAQKSEIWANTLGTAAVVGGFAWLGVDMGAIEDAYVLAINLSNGDVWDIATNEDHYSDRTGGANSANIPFGHPPFVWLLNPTDQMEILIGCRGLANYHIGASLTFQYLSPAPTPVSTPTPMAQGSVKP